MGYMFMSSAYKGSKLVEETDLLVGIQICFLPKGVNSAKETVSFWSYESILYQVSYLADTYQSPGTSWS